MSVSESKRRWNGKQRSLILCLPQTFLKHNMCISKGQFYLEGLTSNSQDAPVALDSYCSVLCFSWSVVAYNQTRRNLANYPVRMGWFGWRKSKIFCHGTNNIYSVSGTVQGSGVHMWSVRPSSYLHGGHQLEKMTHVIEPLRFLSREGVMVRYILH